MSQTEIFLLVMLTLFLLPFAVWRLGRTDYFAPLVVIQIITGILLGPGIAGNFFPESYHLLFSSTLIANLNGLAWWAVILFVMIAGIELDLSDAWSCRAESSLTAGLALGVPLLFGSAVAMVLMATPEWRGELAKTWQFNLAIGMSCAVSALPILILFLEKMQLFRTPLGQRVLRYASLDDIAIWTVLAVILMDWTRILRQVIFLVCFFFLAALMRRLFKRLEEKDRWYLALVWGLLCALCADWAGLHFMVGAFLAGVILDANWFDRAKLDELRHTILLTLMPIFFLSTGLKTNWSMGGTSVFILALALLAAAISGKYVGVYIAGRLLKWQRGEASIIAWLLQTKALIMIIFANVLLDKKIITDATFTALLLMAIMSTMLTVPMVQPKLKQKNDTR